MRLGLIAAGADPITPDYQLLKASLAAAQAATPTAQVSNQVQEWITQDFADGQSPLSPYYHGSRAMSTHGSFCKTISDRDNQQ